MIKVGRPRCPQCGARLRRGRQPGQLCDPCLKVGPDPRAKLPADFYDQQPVLGWLAGYDFGPFLRQVRALTGWSQQTLGGVTGLDQPTISAVERGEHRLRHVEDVAALARGLQIPPVRLNFPDIRATVSATGTAGQKDVSWVDRRDFGEHTARLVLGIAAATGLDIDRLLALLPQPEPTATRQVGQADVEVIEHLTAAFVRQDYVAGSGSIRDAALAQLHTALPLLDSEIAPELRPRLQIATARLATMAGWASFDVQRHDAARRLWLIGLEIARAAEHPFGTDLSGFLLYDMALQSLHLGRPREALHLTRIGLSAAVGRYPVSGSTACALAHIEAWAHAAQGDATACDRALGRAAEQFTSMDPATRPPWSSYLGESSLAAYQGAAHYELALTSRDPRVADRAVPLLLQAVNHFGPDYAKTRARYLPDLAGAQALAGDADIAVSVGHQAIEEITALSAPRLLDRLRILHTVLEPLHTSPGVAELRHRLATVAA